jgi:hypothetical protein
VRCRLAAMLARAHEVVLGFPERCFPVRHARSTVLLGSMAAVRSSGRWDTYLAALDPGHRAILLEAVAATWIPIETAVAHYGACDALGLTPDQVAAIGRGTFDRTGATVFGTIVKMAKGAGVTPWTMLPHLQRFWERGYDGGGVRVVKVGPKEALVDLVDVPLLDLAYYRDALRGHTMGVLDLFCTRSYVTTYRPSVRKPGTVTYRLQWA